MGDEKKTRKKLIEELVSLKQRIQELEQSESERKRIVEALRVSEAKYRNLFDQATDGIMMMPIDGTNFTVNKSFAKLHGYGNPKEMEHLRLSDLDTPETAKLAPERLRRLLTGEAMNFEVEHYHKNGHSLFLDVSCNIVQIEGKPHFLGVHKDITERKRIDEALQRVHNELEQRVADRTKELTQVNEELRTEIAERKRLEESLEKHHAHLEQLVKERTDELLSINEKLQSEITERKKLLSILKQSKRNLESKTRTLEEVNTALKVLLRQRDADREEMKARFASNVNQLVFPYIERIRKGRLDVKQNSYINILKANLHEIVSPFLHNISHLNFTPKEVQVSALIKEGRSTKEIAEIMGLSTSSIDTHRNNIRKKLGLNNKKTNLQSRLQSLG